MLIIVRFKSCQDILQGVNKLDYFLKVSVFQKYKDKNLENMKLSMISDSLIDTVTETSIIDNLKTSLNSQKSDQISTAGFNEQISSDSIK